MARGGNPTSRPRTTSATPARSMREIADEIEAMPLRWDRANALEALPEPLQSHVREIVLCRWWRAKWARGEA